MCLEHGGSNALLFLLCNAEAAKLLLIHGRNELEEKRIPSWLVFLKMVRLQSSRRTTLNCCLLSLDLGLSSPSLAP